MRLVRSKPLPNETRFLPMRAHMVCPNCSGALELNLHPMEEKFHKNALWLVLPGIAGMFLENIWLLLLSAILMTVAAGYVSCFIWKNLRSWLRYKQFEVLKTRKRPTHYVRATPRHFGVFPKRGTHRRT